MIIYQYVVGGGFDGSQLCKFYRQLRMRLRILLRLAECGLSPFFLPHISGKGFALSCETSRFICCGSSSNGSDRLGMQNIVHATARRRRRPRRGYVLLSSWCLVSGMGKTSENKANARSHLHIRHCDESLERLAGLIPACKRG
jgi:hypothetical protein